MPDFPDLRRVHIVIVQPAGYVHSLGLLDPALYLRHQLGRLGIEVSLGKNRLREDAVNVVLGAHLGFAPRLRERHACVFLNLEQIGSGGASLAPRYLELLKTSPTADCDPDNVGGYASDPGLVPVLPFFHAPYLCPQEPSALQDRPIELLFFGGLNERRVRLIERVRACGRTVHVLTTPLFGPERDSLVRQARAVLNCHFYETARFESIRVVDDNYLGRSCCLTKECYSSGCCRSGCLFESSMVEGCGHVVEGGGGGQRSREAARCPRSPPVRRRRIVHMSMACRARSARPPAGASFLATASDFNCHRVRSAQATQNHFLRSFGAPRLDPALQRSQLCLAGIRVRNQRCQALHQRLG